MQFIALKLKKLFHFIFAIGRRFTEKGKIQIEVEKLKWELKKLYLELGKYVIQQKETQSVIDFSHDIAYMQKINEIIKLKFYIEERLKSKETLKDVFSK